jgi:hypothetical protein
MSPRELLKRMKNHVFLLALLFLIAGCTTGNNLKESTVFYPPLPQLPRLQYLFSINSEDDISDPGSAITEFLIGDMPSDKQIGKPYDIGSTPGKIYVLDKRYDKLLIIDLAARTFSHLDDTGMGALSEPSGIWVADDDTKYITDIKRKQVVVFDADNNYQRVYGNDDLFDKPVDVAVYQDSVYVCDMDKHQILILDKDSGALKKTIGELGKEEGQFHKPSHINLDREGNLYVNDAFNYRSQKFDRKGRFIKSFGFHGDTFGAFARPKGLDIDNDGHMYVVDSAYENTQIFDAESGRLLLFFGGGGVEQGNMYLPTAVHIDYANAQYYKNFADKDFTLEYVVYVGNMFGNNKLSVYGFGQWTGPELLAGAGDNSEPEKQGQ